MKAVIPPRAFRSGSVRATTKYQSATPALVIHFGAIDDVLVAFLDRRGLHSLNVTAGARFGDGVGTHGGFLDHGCKVFLMLCVGAAQDDGLRQAIGFNGGADARIPKRVLRR